MINNPVLVVQGGSGTGSKLIVTCDEDFAGLSITASNGTVNYTEICPTSSPYVVEFVGLEAGTWTIRGNVDGVIYTVQAVVEDETAILHSSFNWILWCNHGGVDVSHYSSINDLLIDETNIRRLLTVHESVDYFVSSNVNGLNSVAEKVLNNVFVQKWTNLRDYALDEFEKSATIKTKMDAIDKFGYGELTYISQVPVLTSNTGSNGTASASSNYSGRDSYYAFADSSTLSNYGWLPDTNDTLGNAYVQYTFTSAQKIGMVSLCGTYT